MSLGEDKVARGYFENALNIYENIGSPGHNKVREKIRQLEELKRSKNEPET